MYNDPDIERFFQELKEKISTPAPPGNPAPPDTPSTQITVLAQPEGDVVARLIMLGGIAGEFYRISNGEVHFHYSEDKTRRWYVNKNLAAFRDAATIFNKCGQQACENSEKLDEDPEGMWVLEQLRSELDGIEPLGDPETSLWSATVH